ncbi:cyclin-I [Engraulis encrasicolus]|uniref:cyclin-I n=1 Tax=Engraulis encrasicolus TaxID=184585 RepID=UPI002FD3BDC0
MKLSGSEESSRLGRLLEDALARETRLWKAPVLEEGHIQGTDISLLQLQEVILWLREMNAAFPFCQETYALAVCVLNRLLATVKAQRKYLKCMALTCLILAAKINEEDEVIASVRDLLAQSGCSFSTAEIHRMERIILDKLQWDLYTATPIDFIHIFHALLLSSHPLLLPLSSSSSSGSAVGGVRRSSGPGAVQKRPCLQAALWTRQVQHCMALHQLWQCRGSTLALAIITLELETSAEDWLTAAMELLNRAQMDSLEFIRCKEMVDECLYSLDAPVPPNAVYILNSTHLTRYRPPGSDSAPYPEQGSRWRRKDRPRRRKRGGKATARRGERETDEYYDGFRCLYDGITSDSDHQGDSGNVDHLTNQEASSPSCPPLQPHVIG